MKIVLVALLVLLVARPSTTRAEQDTVRLLPTSAENDLSPSLPHTSRRELLLLGRSTFCRKLRGGGRNYKTKSIRRIFANVYLNSGAEPGRCSTVCKKVCRHVPCRDDFILDGESCECIDGEPLSQCSSNTFCSSDKCLCSPGYKGTPIAGSAGCSDIDECTAPALNNCTSNTDCANKQGSFSCACKKGYVGNPTSSGPEGCQDINECASNSTLCGPASIGSCENTVGGYICRCIPGYLWDNPSGNGICVDVNECPVTNCGSNAVCNNFAGGFNCTCRAGYNSTGTPPGQPCTDINECSAVPRVCGLNATCTNLMGSFSCTCDPGYEGTPPNCVPDACTKAGRVCGVNTRCNVTDSTNPSCNCLSFGYTRNTTIVNGTVFFCDDVNECLNPAVCPTNQNCFNFPGTFFCGIKAFNACPSGQDATCSPGLQCAQLSRSDSKIVCCPSTSTCESSKCCNDAYTVGEPCPSRSNDDCEGSLECGRTVASPTFKCCANTETVVGVRFCL